MDGFILSGWQEAQEEKRVIYVTKMPPPAWARWVLSFSPFLSVLSRSVAQLIELHLVFKVIDVNTFKLIMFVSWVRALDECPPLAQRKLNPYTFVISCLIKSIQIPVTLSDTFSSQCNRSKIVSCQNEIILRWLAHRPPIVCSLTIWCILHRKMASAHWNSHFWSDWLGVLLRYEH